MAVVIPCLLGGCLADHAAGPFLTDIRIRDGTLVTQSCEMTYQVDNYRPAVIVAMVPLFIVLIPLVIYAAATGGGAGLGGGGGGGGGDKKSARSFQRTTLVTAGCHEDSTAFRGVVAGETRAP
jgi:hypothetical protein